MNLLRLLGEQFFVTFLCIGPGSICAGALLVIPFVVLFKIIDLDALKKRKGINIEIPVWLTNLSFYFPMGLVAFPLARLVFGLEIFRDEWNIWSYIIITSALCTFAVVTAFLGGFPAEKGASEKQGEGARLLVILGSYVGGVLVGALLTGFYFPMLDG